MYNAVCDELLHSAEGLFLTAVHMVLGIAVLAANGAAAAWGSVSWVRQDPSVWFWYLLRAAQAVTVVQAILGFILFAQGERAPDGLHLAYGISPIVVAFLSEGLRVNAAARELEGIEDVDSLGERERGELARRIVLREQAIMTVGVILIVTLVLRAVQSGG